MPLPLLEGRLARKLRSHIFHLQILREVSESRTKQSFHIFNFHFWREVSHESFVLISSIATFWVEVSRESFVFISSTFRFCRKSRTKPSFLHVPLPLFEGHLARKLRSHIFHLQILREVSESRTKQSFHIFNFHFWREVSHESFVLISSIATFFGGGLARKLRFHIFNFQILQEVLHETFVFTCATATF